MTRADVVRALNEEYARLRDENDRAREARIDEVIAADPAIEPLVRGGAALFRQKARQLLMHPERAEALAKETREQVRANDAALRERLKALGYAETYLDPIYRCPVCHDTGYVGAGVREECACFRQRVSQRLYEASAAETDALQTFERFDASIIPNDVKLDMGYTQRELATAVCRVCRDYAAQYPATQKLGLVLMGQTGLGKTFLLNCVGNALIARGFAPVKLTGYRLYEAMRAAQFGGEDRRAEFNQLLSCDILLIDDLGTEPVIQGVTREYLFSLLNERLVRRRHTVIATNLSHADLMAVYGERVFSRLMDGMNMMPVELKGKDLRLCALGK